MKKQTKEISPLKNKLQEYFSTFLFPWVRASNEKTFSKSKPLKNALNYKYIDPNNNGYIRVLTIDIDWPIPMDEYIDQIPMPNVIVSNPENDHVQIMYFLKSRLYRENAKIMYAYQMIKDNLNRILKGDFSFAGRLQKNPLHSCWNTTWFNNDPYPLTDLINWSMKQELDANGDSCRVHDFASRNETIFHSLLKYACRHNKGLTYEILESHARYLNNLIPTEFDTTIKVPLDITELLGIVRSVWKFMKTRYTGHSRKGEGQYTDEQRKKSIETRTAKKWQNIHRFIEYRKMKLSLNRIAELLNVTLKTIKNYASALHANSSFVNSSLFAGTFLTADPSFAPTKNAGSAEQHAAAAPLPPVLRMITDTVFQRIRRLIEAEDAEARELAQNTS
ncbi:MAG: replication initiation protein [Dysgonamonadaceae bacterium]|nr:replication initiation protein [Dysgonamonadaceae bacterium]